METGLAGADFRREDPVADETFVLGNGRGSLKGGALRLEAGFVRFMALVRWLMDQGLLALRSFSASTVTRQKESGQVNIAAPRITLT